MGVRHWAAVRISASDGPPEEFGRTAGEDAIPAAMRRRMGRLDRLAIRCTMGALAGASADELIFCSRYGNVEVLSGLLRAIAEGQLTSPMAFSGSVHNAVPGLIGQIRRERLSHTAIAAGRDTLAAGLIEAYARLASDGCDCIAVTFADLPLPEHFRPFEDEILPGLALTMLVGLSSGRDGATAVRIEPGRRGALALLESLREGPVDLAMDIAA